MQLQYISSILTTLSIPSKGSTTILSFSWPGTGQAETSIAFDDFPSIQAVPTPPTRGDEVLDILFTNMSRSVVNTDVSASHTEQGLSGETK